MGPFPISNGYSYILLIVDYAVATKINDAKVVGATFETESCPLYSTSMGWCTELQQHITPRQMAKLKYSIRKSRKFYTRWSISVEKTGADSLRKLYEHIELHTELC
ncbi:hypothetical protein CR513_05937, partial [Mucuna pruriens]